LGFQVKDHLADLPSPDRVPKRLLLVLTPFHPYAAANYPSVFFLYPFGRLYHSGRRPGSEPVWARSLGRVPPIPHTPGPKRLTPANGRFVIDIRQRSVGEEARRDPRTRVRLSGVVHDSLSVLPSDRPCEACCSLGLLELRGNGKESGFNAAGFSPYCTGPGGVDAVVRPRSIRLNGPGECYEPRNWRMPRILGVH
jgi:hypothetical protein